MKTIRKYPFSINDEVRVGMPADAEILSVQVQRGTPCLWAMVDSERLPKDRILCIYGTGHQIDPFRLHTFIGTIQMDGGNLVFHVFEVIG